MLKKNHEGIPYFEFELFQEFRGGLRHAVFTRHPKVFFAPNTNITDPKPLQKILETDAVPILFKKQLHGNSAWVVEKKDLGAMYHETDGDALITEQLHAPLVIRIADCASVLIFDPIRRVIANIHGGWRGLAQKIIRNSINLLCERFACHSENLHACISPMLGPCCAQFSNPEEELPQFLHSYILKKNMVDLWAIAEAQLRESGLSQSHIENPRMCTMCHPEEFFSYRREGNLGRFGTAIMLK